MIFWCNFTRTNWGELGIQARQSNNSRRAREIVMAVFLFLVWRRRSSSESPRFLFRLSENNPNIYPVASPLGSSSIFSPSRAYARFPNGTPFERLCGGCRAVGGSFGIGKIPSFSCFQGPRRLSSQPMTADGLTVDTIASKGWPILDESESDWRSHAAAIAQSVQLIKKRLQVEI